MTAMEILLRRLKEALRDVDYAKALEILKESQLEPPAGTEFELTRLAIHSIASEIYDYFGKDQEAARWIEFEEIRRERVIGSLLKSGFDPAIGPIEALRSENKTYILVLLRCGYTKYRIHEYKEALRLWNLCIETVTTRMVSGDYPCHGTLTMKKQDSTSPMRWTPHRRTRMGGHWAAGHCLSSGLRNVLASAWDGCLIRKGSSRSPEA